MTVITYDSCSVSVQLPDHLAKRKSTSFAVQNIIIQNAKGDHNIRFLNGCLSREMENDYPYGPATC